MLRQPAFCVRWFLQYHSFTSLSVIGESEKQCNSLQWHVSKETLSVSWNCGIKQGANDRNFGFRYLFLGGGIFGHCRLALRKIVAYVIGKVAVIALIIPYTFQKLEKLFNGPFLAELLDFQPQKSVELFSTLKTTSVSIQTVASETLLFYQNVTYCNLFTWCGNIKQYSHWNVIR